jgi:hypothetical protein
MRSISFKPITTSNDQQRWRLNRKLRYNMPTCGQLIKIVDLLIVLLHVLLKSMQNTKSTVILLELMPSGQLCITVSLKLDATIETTVHWTSYWYIDHSQPHHFYVAPAKIFYVDSAPAPAADNNIPHSTATCVLYCCIVRNQFLTCQVHMAKDTLIPTNVTIYN